ncbi:LysR family transcriptional regulator [Tunturibacter empetritectus]|uniref:DNA-binding transcriptional LysR family regulator n=1 Tax=Tunturiibacter empetritectus TaxID=3069691 RepID=A0A7W8MRW1_9BACT|nr:LysR family transcriptional regulator [Edaphobacter lichenicola]MBB5318058.1 DNA-binding transcriptional LysR family regulator [Edaphobacter lichenicola]
MDLVQMETFLAVAEERSFSRAAARLHRTQPAVSQAIAKLEGELGEVLFERSSRDGTLTDAGEVLREYASKLLNLRNEAAGALTELRELHRGRLNLAANEYTCLYLLPLLDEFRRQNPRIKLAVQRTLASRISDEVLMHSVELGVLSFRPDDTQVKSMVVYRDELAFVVNPRHPLAGAGKVSIRQLGGQNFIAHNIPSPQRQKVIQAFKRHKTPLQMGVELPSLEAIKRFVEMGNGVALVPGLTVRTELESGALVRVQVPELQIERKLRLVYRRQASLSHAALAFLNVVEAYAAAHGDPYCFQAERGV